MGIKENFTQAVKELTGMGKEKNPEKSNTVDELKKAVNDGSDLREISLDSVPDWDGSEASTVRPIPHVNQTETSSGSEPDTTPKAEAFLSGESVPVSLFGGGNQSQQTPSQEQPPVFTQQPQPIPAPAVEPQPAQPQYAPQPQQAHPQSQYAGGMQQPPPSQGGYTNRNIYPAQISPIPSPTPVLRTTSGQDDSELTIISRNTVIDGNIRSFADMSIDGDIKGDVETTKNIDLNGKIIGNVTCNNAMMHTSQVQGNIRMKGNVSMKRDTLLIGDLMSTYAEVNGKVKGNLDVVGKADLKGDAVVFGDISASTITVEDGAIIQGYVSTTFLNKEESKNLFPDTVVIGDAGNATRL